PRDPHSFPTRRSSDLTISLHGPETAATRKAFPPEAEWFGIAFKLGTFVPHLLPGSFIDRNIVLPGTSGRAFWLCHSAWQFPTFEDRKSTRLNSSHVKI